jgi:hypothetical protein
LPLHWQLRGFIAAQREGLLEPDSCLLQARYGSPSLLALGRLLQLLSTWMMSGAMDLATEQH